MYALSPVLTVASSTTVPEDQDAPTLSSATVNGTTLVLTYDEALDTNSVPATAAFTVTAGPPGPSE